jgi:hypothetical protein
VKPQHVVVKPQPSPSSIYKGFSQNEKGNVSANKDSHMLDTKANVGIPFDATKASTARASAGGLKHFHSSPGGRVLWPEG